MAITTFTGKRQTDRQTYQTISKQDAIRIFDAHSAYIGRDVMTVIDIHRTFPNWGLDCLVELLNSKAFNSGEWIENGMNPVSGFLTLNGWLRLVALHNTNIILEQRSSQIGKALRRAFEDAVAK